MLFFILNHVIFSNSVNRWVKKKYLILTVGLDCYFHDYNFGVKFRLVVLPVIFLNSVNGKRKKWQEIM